MAQKDFILERICIFAGEEVDPNVDKEVEEMLRTKFEIHLPQRRSMNESLMDATSDHEILKLIIQYRSL